MLSALRLPGPYLIQPTKARTKHERNGWESAFQHGSSEQKAGPRLSGRSTDPAPPAKQVLELAFVSSRNFLDSRDLRYLHEDSARCDAAGFSESSCAKGRAQFELTNLFRSSGVSRNVERRSSDRSSCLVPQDRHPLPRHLRRICGWIPFATRRDPCDQRPDSWHRRPPGLNHFACPGGRLNGIHFQPGKQSPTP
jgi:hypothetical protein